ncbi:NAD-dependent deacylase [Hoeflea prorocentri]|uniref:NAD-dependent protein deacylase n=1 Tax=Hoeflea prorocentri TaxID=1922333 RepID=A0A9X3ZG16_9HYPH|nr:NAD-dependent deacylase [Hoeflea prorocentri]MCY6379453.1 NAD-dependent deacylase [Hoeflea prorocentri]MDA5397253.1 NAD-dependent deacylase [Hoeflea prorocentri]
MTNLPYERIVVLTGAGLSAESGLSTFRDKDGIWSKVRIEDVATPEAFARDPQGVLDFYNGRRNGAGEVEPNAAHAALARLEAEHKGDVLTVTQNIDPLHEAAGTRNLVHMHGEIRKVLCNHCGTRTPYEDDLTVDLVCTQCGNQGGLRPDVVWFGEMPYQMDRIYAALGACDLFISIGTSGNVYPAAGFVAEARGAGARTVELNLEPSEGITMFDEAIHGKATQVVPAYVERLLNGG